MKKPFLLLLALSALMPVACVKNILPETNQSIEGRWAHVVDGIFADYWLSFNMGKCYTYTSSTLHYYSDNTIWLCRPDDFGCTYSEYYAIKDSCLQVSATPDGFDAVNLGKVSIKDDVLTVGNVKYSRLVKLTGLPSPYDAVKTVAVNPSSLILKPGDVGVLTTIVTPSSEENVHLVWKSDNPQVVCVDDFGRVRAVSTGFANVTAQAPNGVYGICTITVKEK